MRILIALAFIIGVAWLTAPHVPTVTQQLPAGVTTGWPIDPANPETNCRIGIHYEDSLALTDAQLDTARRYVAHTCWGAPDNWPADTEHTYYHHH